jgi:Ni/Co efflux regulator RcnB
MNIIKLATAAALALSTLAMPAAASAAPMGHSQDRVEQSSASKQMRNHRGDRRWNNNRYNRGRHNGWRNNHRRWRSCRNVWRHGHRQRICTWRYRH